MRWYSHGFLWQTSALDSYTETELMRNINTTLLDSHRTAIFGLATFTRLRTLDIRNVFFANYGEFHRIVAAFPALLTLRMQITSWRSPVGGIAQAVYPFQTRFPSIRRCEIAPIFPVSLSILYDIVDYQSPINLDCPSSRTIAGSTAGFSPISADHYRH